jgi:serine/threonine-protein kinase
MTDMRLLGGRYQLGEILGYGGMAEVHRGRDQRLGRDVAVKVLRADLARDPGFQLRFRREAQNAAALNHPAIVAVYDTADDSGSATDVPYIVMEYVAGRTLKEVLTEEGRLMPERAMELTADICAALEFSHRNGIVHRDIKPGNVMLTPGGAVKVMDFGIARAVAGATSTMTQTSAVIGTAQYLSPEQARGETVDARSDVYSTGCLLYELLVGEPPFTGDSPVAVAYQHVREDPVPPSTKNPEISRVIDAIVLKAMAKNPANRYQSAAEMRADLLRAAAGRPVAATPVMSAEERTQLLSPVPGPRGPRGPVEVPDSRTRRGAVLAAIAVAVVVVFALAALGTAYVLGNRTPQVTVLNVQGMAESTARQRLTEQGLSVKVQKIESSTEQEGKVKEQDLKPGREVDRGSEIHLTVGAGPKKTPAPDLVGSSLAGAQQLASAADVKLSSTEVDSEKPAGQVLSQSVEANTPVVVDSTIEITVSRGNLVIVKNVVGKDVVEARRLLEADGFTVVINTQSRPDITQNQVISQNPIAEAKYPKGSPVTILIAKTPPPESPSASPSTSPSTEPLVP